MRLLTVLGLCANVLTAWPMEVERVAVLTYPIEPRLLVTILPASPSMAAPKLHRDFKKTEEMEDRLAVVSYVMVENVLIVDGTPTITGPPTRANVDNISVQLVPPRPLVSKTFPVERKSPVFESRA
jgi:hypothetical protein